MTELARSAANQDPAVVAGFGDEWSRFDQTSLDDTERLELFREYFAVFPWHRVAPDAVGFDLGCGSGRWAALVAPRVGVLHCIDPSRAIDVARRNLAEFTNVRYHQAEVADLQRILPAASCDFGYSLGVLHHVPDTQAGLARAAAALKPGAPLLVYLYYAFDNRPAWFRGLWRASNLARLVVSRAPRRLRHLASEAIAWGVYWPLSRAARLAERAGLAVHHWPLSAYRARSVYTMRTDALDRFGTRLEKRFTRASIRAMMEAVGLHDVVFHDGAPYWCAVGIKG